MQTVLPSEFKRMMALMLEGGVCLVEDFHVSGSAQTKHKLHVRLRQLKTGHIIDRVFAENERIPVVELETRRITYSYSQAGTYVFLDEATFEQIERSDEQLGERRWFLKEGVDCKVLLLDGKVIDIALPAHVPLQVVDTAPPTRGGSDSAWKEAKLETGLHIMVPLFIGKGETVRVDTAEKKYAGREALSN